jgi:hypothetical protein
MIPNAKQRYDGPSIVKVHELLNVTQIFSGFYGAGFAPVFDG